MVSPKSSMLPFILDPALARPGRSRDDLLLLLNGSPLNPIAAASGVTVAIPPPAGPASLSAPGSVLPVG